MLGRLQRGASLYALAVGSPTHVRATATVTLALPQTASPSAGMLPEFLADIGMAPPPYARPGLPAEPLFGSGDLLAAPRPLGNPQA